MLNQKLKLICACTLTGALLTTVDTALAQSDVALDRISATAENRPLQSLRAAAQRANQRAFKPGPPRQVLNFVGEGDLTLVDRNGPDPLLQSSTLNLAATSVTGGFFGASNNDNGAKLGILIAPPDTDGHVGPNHYVQMINLLTTIYNKDGSIAVDSFASNAFWFGIGGNCEAYNQGDPIVLYDEVEDRWIVSQFAFPDNLSSFSQCVAVSQTGDPTGAFNRYEFSFDGVGFNDYPKHGIVDGGITMIANLFQPLGPFFNYAGTFLGVMDKTRMYNGQTAELLGQNIGTSEFGFLPADLDGTGSSPALFATAMSTPNAFDIWEADFDFNAGTIDVSQIASIPVSPYDADICGASREACVPQPSPGPALEAITDRLMHRLQIRDFGSYRTMVTGHTVDVGGGRTGIRWYEFRESSGTWSLYQEGTYGPNDGEFRWMPSVAMNGAGDIGIGYLLASGNTFVSTAVAGQSAANSGTGLLDAAEIVCAAGSGVQTDVARAGDYSSTSVDPLDDSFWHTNEVFTQTGQFQWNTFVCNFTVGDGTPPANNPPNAGFTFTTSDLTANFTDTSGDSDGSIVGWSWDFGDGSGTSTAQNPSYTYTAAGTYTVTLEVTDDDGATDVFTDNVTVSEPAPNNPPTAAFTVATTDLTADFTDGSSDGDGSVVGWSWDFGDLSGGSTAQNPSYTYAAAGTYTVSLTVTDDDGATDTTSQLVTVEEPVAGDITLTANGRKERGRHVVDLSWTDSGATDYDVYRDGDVVGTATGTSFTDNTGNRGGATYVYQVCEAGTGTCSNTATVVY